VSEDATLQVDHFMFSPSIADNMRTASLVISHAGNIVFPYGEKCKDNGIFFMACVMAWVPERQRGLRRWRTKAA